MYRMSVDALAGSENHETYTLDSSTSNWLHALGKLISLNLIYFTYNRNCMRLNISNDSLITRCYSVYEWW